MSWKEKLSHHEAAGTDFMMRFKISSHKAGPDIRRMWGGSREIEIEGEKYMIEMRDIAKNQDG